MKKTTYIIAMFLILSQGLLSACLDEKADNLPKLPARTILFFMVGDDGLEEEIQRKTDALAAAWQIEGDNHLLVYRTNTDTYRATLLEITQGQALERVQYDPGYVSFAAELSRAINDMTGLYPGTDYGLILFSRSGGWLPQGTHITPSSVAGVGGNQEFELADFARIIPDGQFRFIIFESDHMAGIEVAYELKDKTALLLASAAPIPSPGFTPLYANLLTRLYKETPELSGFAADYCDYCNTLEGDARSATLSVISTAGLAAFKPFLKGVEDAAGEEWRWLPREQMQHFDLRHSGHLFYDLADYIDLIGTPQDADRLIALLTNVLLYRGSTPSFQPGHRYGYDINHHCGLTIYVQSPDYPYLNRKRKQLALFN